MYLKDFRSERMTPSLHGKPRSHYAIEVPMHSVTENLSFNKFYTMTIFHGLKVVFFHKGNRKPAFNTTVSELSL